MDNKKAWRRYPIDRIPTKEEIPRFLYQILEEEKAKRIADLGCGLGKWTRELARLGYKVIGLDINASAMAMAKRLADQSLPGLPPGRLIYLVGDATALPFKEGVFDAVILQLVISIIGGPWERRRLLQQSRALLRRDGILYLSAAGISSDINPGYARLYQEGLELVGERYSYLSRDPQSNQPLYLTHHFSQEELEDLLRDQFDILLLRQQREFSSRRPQEPAYFFYIIARRR